MESNSEKYSNGIFIFHISKMTRIDPRICLKVLVSKFDPKSPKGSVPNGQS